MQQDMLIFAEASNKFSNLLKLVHDDVLHTHNAAILMSDISTEGAMLALNAEIEAVNTGKYRQSFSKLTHEISRFADKTASSNQKIEEIIREMTSNVENGRTTVSGCLQEIVIGTDRLRIVGYHLGGLTSEIEKQSKTFDNVEEITQQNALQAEQLIKSIAPLAESAEESSSLIHHVQEAITQLANTAEELREVLNMFFKAEFKKSKGI